MLKNTSIEISEKNNLKEKIQKLCKEKNAVIMAHYYQPNDIQDIAHFVGDSLALAQWAKQTNADIIVVCGVHFMGETAKILSPGKKVLIPDLNAGCSLADSCPADKFEEFIRQYPGYKVISYVNTTAAVKALTDICVTSTNARKIVEQFPSDAKLIFGPDKNLGDYINSTTGRKMILWNGACHVHEQFSLEKILELKAQYPDALVLAHPECKKPVLMVADFIGSTQALLNYATQSEKRRFIIVTESGVIHEMKKKNPGKEFIPAPPIDSSCGCSECNFMRLNTMEKLYNCLLNEQPEILIDETLRRKAEKSILQMLEMS
ncbi:MAG: quinolinate synthase NadA [Prevotellaceae bacterium]|jgi:quinolinate synthase|nr:quinolinate synthase NadA [Prevotellaceae bacterium]